VQGRLTGAPVSVHLESRCALCARPIRLEVDQELRWHAPDPGLRPLIMEPSVDWSCFLEPTILHAY
jgi:hypothetical protein